MPIIKDFDEIHVAESYQRDAAAIMRRAKKFSPSAMNSPHLHAPVKFALKYGAWDGMDGGTVEWHGRDILHILTWH